MAAPFRFQPRPLPVAAAIGVIAQALFAFRVATPHQLVFDEVHYVPAARVLATLAQPTNIEHPLLAKLLIALGIALFGDTSTGWRLLSTLGGTGVVVGVFALLWLGTRRMRPAVIGAVVTTLDFTVFVQARIAMLDGFLAAFVVLGAASLLWAMRAPTTGACWRRWTLGAVLLGLATACKWVAAPYVAAAAVAVLVLRCRHAERWAGQPVWALVAALGVVSVATYFATFAPAFFYDFDSLGWRTLIPFQLRMYAAQTQVLPPHTYQSSWWSWPLDIRPIWYLYEVADGAQRGILMIGNPAVMWGGLVAVGMSGWRWLSTRDTAAGVAAVLWLFSLGIWAIIPKSLGFFYYYYLSSIWLSLAIALVLERRRRWAMALLVVAAALFVYFYPILAATRLDGPQAFTRWMWLGSWR